MDWLTRFPSLSLIAVALLVMGLERLWPHHAVDRRRDLGLDLVGVVAGLVAVVVAYGALRAAVPVLRPAAWTDATRPLQALPSAAKVAVVVLLADFTIYWLHRLMHRWPLTWRMHRWHHTIEHMYWFAGFRASFLHVLLYGLPQVFLPTLVVELDAAEVAAATAIANLVQVWTHANIRVRCDALQWLIVTPDYHRLHHRADGAAPRNFGNLLTLWDRLFGTHEAPSAGRSAPCGLGEPRPGLLRMLVGI